MVDDKVILFNDKGFSIPTLFKTPIEEFSDAECHAVYSFLDGMAKRLNTRAEAIKARLKAVVLKEGAEDAKGHKSLTINGAQVTAQKRKGKVEVNSQAAERLLKAKGVDLDRGGDISWTPNAAAVRVLLEEMGKPLERYGTVTFAADPDKLEALVGLDILTVEEVAACCVLGQATYAMIIKPMPQVDKLLKESLD